MNGQSKPSATRVYRGVPMPVLAVCAACLIAVSAPVRAQPQIALSTATVEAGGTATLTLSASDLPEDVGGLHIEFTVPAEVSFGGVAAGPGLAGFASESYTFTDGGAACGGFIAFSSSRAMDPAQSLATISFQVDGAAADATANVPFTGSWLSNVPGTAVLAHTTGSGTITIGQGGGGGDSLADIAQFLYDRFDSADTDGSGSLSFDEAVAARPSLTQTQFDAIDTNDDGMITLAELLGAGAVAPPVGPSCCDPAKRFTVSDFKRYLGDIVLLGLALGALGGMGAMRRRP